MKIDGINLVNDSKIRDAVIEFGPSLPTSTNAQDEGRIFVLRAVDGQNQPGLYLYDGSAWSDINDNSMVDADLLDGLDSLQFVRSDQDDTLTGVITFEGTQPKIRFNETDAITDESKWEVLGSGGNFFIRTVTDAGVPSQNAFEIGRSATMPDFARFYEPTYHVGGSEATPSITFDGDTDTGIYRQGSDNLAITAGGSQQAQFYTGGVIIENRLFAADGSAGSPSIAFTNDADMGFYRGGADSFTATTNGTPRFTVNGNGLNISNNGSLFLPGTGSALSPDLRFTGDDNTGLYRVGADDIGITVGGTLRFSIDTTDINVHNHVITNLGTPVIGTDAATKDYVDAQIGGMFGDGTVSAPGIAFAADTDTGIYRPTTNTIAMAVGAVNGMTLDANGLRTPVKFVAGTGTSSSPVYAFDGDTDTGMANPSANTIGMYTGGIERLSIDSLGALTVTSDTTTINVTDNRNDAFLVAQSANNYIEIDTTNGSELIRLGNATTSPNVNVDGTVRVNTGDNTRPFRFRRNTSDGEALQIGIVDASAKWLYTNDEAAGQIDWDINNTDTETGGGASANTGGMSLYQSIAGTQLLLPGSGTAAAPNFTFAGDTDIGMFRHSADNIGFATGGTLAGRFTASQDLQLEQRLLNVNGTAANPTVTFVGDDDTGLYREAADTLGITAGGVKQVEVDGTNTTFSGTLRAPAGEINNIAYGFEGQTGIGMYRVNSDLYIISNGSSLITGISGKVTLHRDTDVQGELRVGNGTVGAPSLSFTTTTDMGFYRPVSNTLGLVTDGTERVRWSSSGMIVLSGGLRMQSGLPISAENGNASQPGYNFENDSNTGVYRSASDVLGLSAGGIARMTLGASGIDALSHTISNVSTPVSDNDAANKAYVDSIASGLDLKESVRAATTANITLSGTQTVDSVVLTVGDRVLVKDQSSGSENGIYDVAAGSWTRSEDADGTPANEVTSGMYCFVEEGGQAGSGWVLTTPDPITVGTTALTFTQFSESTSLTAGTGIDITSSVISFDQTYGDNRYINVTGDTMTGALTIPVGAQATPSINFAGDTDTGIYREADNVIGFTASGVSSAFISGTEIRGKGRIRADGDVTAGTVSTDDYVRLRYVDDMTSRYGFVSDSGSGVLINEQGSRTQAIVISDIDDSRDAFGFSTNSTTPSETTGSEAGWTKSFAVSGLGQARVQTSSQSQPNYSFFSDTGTGMYSGLANTISFATNSTRRFGVSDTVVDSSVRMSITSDGSSVELLKLATSVGNTAGIRFEGVAGDVQSVRLEYESSDSNLIAGAGYALRIVSDGAAPSHSVDLEVEGNVYAKRHYATTGSLAAPSFSFHPDTNTGMYSSTGDEINIVTGGTEVMEVTTGLVSVKGVCEAEAFKGVNYTQTSTTGTTSIVDTGITVAEGEMYEVIIKGNPDVNGSSDYRDIVHLNVYITGGFDSPDVKKYITVDNLFSRGTLHGSGGGPLTAGAFMLEGVATEHTDVLTSTTTTLRIKVSGYAEVATVGSGQEVRVKRLI